MAWGGMHEMGQYNTNNGTLAVHTTHTLVHILHVQILLLHTTLVHTTLVQILILHIYTGAYYTGLNTTVTVQNT